VYNTSHIRAVRRLAADTVVVLVSRYYINSIPTYLRVSTKPQRIAHTYNNIIEVLYRLRDYYPPGMSVFWTRKRIPTGRKSHIYFLVFMFRSDKNDSRQTDRTNRFNVSAVSRAWIQTHKYNFCHKIFYWKSKSTNSNIYKKKKKQFEFKK